MACTVKAATGCLSPSCCALEALTRPSTSASGRLGGQGLGFSSYRQQGVGRAVGASRRRRSFLVSAIAEKTEETQAEPVFKLKIENTEDEAPPAPRWTGLVEKDTAGQTNIYSVEPTVYVADGLLSTNSQGPGGSSSTTVAFIGTALLFTALAIGGAVNISQYKAAETAAGGAAVEYVGPPLSFYIEKFSEAPSAAPSPAAPALVDAAPLLAAPALVDAAPSLAVPALVDAAPAVTEEDVTSPPEPLAAAVTAVEDEPVVAVPEIVEAVVVVPEIEDVAPPVVVDEPEPEAEVEQPSVEAVVLPSIEEDVQTAVLTTENVAEEVLVTEPSSVQESVVGEEQIQMVDLTSGEPAVEISVGESTEVAVSEA